MPTQQKRRTAQKFLSLKSTLKFQTRKKLCPKSFNLFFDSVKLSRTFSLFFIKVSKKVAKVLSSIISLRQSRRNDGYVATSQLVDNGIVEDVIQRSTSELELCNMSLPPRYRFRDLLMGDFAFRDDGERWVFELDFGIARNRKRLIPFTPVIQTQILICQSKQPFEIPLKDIKQPSVVRFQLHSMFYLLEIKLFCVDKSHYNRKLSI